MQIDYGRFRKAVAILSERLEQQGACTVVDLAVGLVGKGVGLEAARRWVYRHGTRLAEVTGAYFRVGNPHQPGGFERQERRPWSQCQPPPATWRGPGAGCVHPGGGRRPEGVAG